MAKIDDAIIRRVIDATDIVEVVSDFVDLKKRGARWLGLCPFHDDKHIGSFVVYPPKQSYRCFACGAGGDAVKFLMNHEKLSFLDAIRYLGKKYNIPVDDVPFNYMPPPPRPRPEPLPMLEIPKGMVKSGKLEESVLVNWMLELPWNDKQFGRINKVLEEYHLGQSSVGFTVFWQIDERGRVRTGKMMKYKSDGHRDRDTRYNFDWVHSALGRLHLIDLEKVEVKPCLFGLHLLPKYPDATVCIVESEKTAVLMAITYGNDTNRVWMACGGAENLTKEKLAPIMAEGRNIVLYPDRDKVDDWRQKAKALKYFNMYVDDVPVKVWWKPKDGEKADIADVVLRIMKER